MLSPSLFMFAMGLSHAQAWDRAEPMIEAAVEVAAEPGHAERLFPVLYREDRWAARAKTAKLVIRIAWGESSWDVGAVNPVTKTCSLLQVSPIHLPKGNCAPLLQDRRLAIRYGIEVLERHVAACDGDLAKGLGAFATGRCGAKMPHAIAWCADIGGC